MAWLPNVNVYKWFPLNIVHIVIHLWQIKSRSREWRCLSEDVNILYLFSPQFLLNRQKCLSKMLSQFCLYQVWNSFYIFWISEVYQVQCSYLVYMFLWVNHFRFDWPCVLQPMTPGMSRWALKVLGHFFCFLFSWLSLFFLFRGGGGGQTIVQNYIICLTQEWKNSNNEKNIWRRK